MKSNEKESEMSDSLSEYLWAKELGSAELAGLWRTTDFKRAKVLYSRNISPELKPSTSSTLFVPSNSRNRKSVVNL